MHKELLQVKRKNITLGKWANHLNRLFTKEDIQMTNKCLPGKGKLKLRNITPQTPEQLKFKRLTTASINKDMEQLEGILTH